MKERINYLLKQFESAEISHLEKQELLALVDTNADLVSGEIAELIAKETSPAEILDAGVWEDVFERIVSVDRPLKTRKLNPVPLWKWAAAAVVLIALSLTFFNYPFKNDRHDFASDINPGNHKAILTLANGKKISLTDALNGNLAKEAGISISKTAGGQLVYKISDPLNATEDLASKTNTLTTPNGGDWQIQLPDGTLVWLNAASSLKYPLTFNSVNTLNVLKGTKQRRVELIGEAYFEVAPDHAHPFIVHTLKQDVEVLGTHFNINCYANEIVTRTTLLEGSIKISTETTHNVEILKPNEQAVLSNGVFNIKNVDVDESVAWKNGYFMFNNERQESIMRKIARWYNVEVEYVDEEAKEVEYYGTVSRFDKISQVLRKFEQTGEVRFKIKGNRIIVYKD